MLKQPNVIFILSDQHNAKVTGYNKHPNVKTPNLDRLASGGVRFDNAITQNPICTPSRMCWLSGQYCHNHGYYALNGPNPNGLPTIMGHFKKAGYTTSAIGKIHCPEYWIEDDADNFHETCQCSIGGRSKKYTDYLKENNMEHLEDHIIMQEFGDMGRQSMEGRPSKLTFEQSQEGWIASETIGFVRDAVSSGKPFFAHVSLPRPHQCTSPSEPFWSMYNEDELVLPPNSEYDISLKAPHFKKMVEQWRKGDWALLEPRTYEAARLRKLHGYLSAISQVDHAVGVIMDAVKDMDIAENTIIIYSTDHGDYAAEHGIMEKAPGICSDAITRIPMIWNWQNHFKDGHIATELVETVDMASTLCSLCGLEPFETGDGYDITHLLNGENREVRNLAVTEFAWSRSIRYDKYRLVFYPKQMFAEEYPEGFGELYDLESDPWEMNNLYFEPDYRDIVVKIKEEFVEWLISTTRPATVHGLKPFSTDQGFTRYLNTVNYDGKVNPNRLYAMEGKNYL